MSGNVRALGEPGTLYARCGGIFGIANFVDRCMDGWMESTVLNKNAAVATWHERWQRCGFKFLVAQLFGSLSGGPQRYTGRPIDVAHKHLNISGAEWEEFMIICRRVCDSCGLDVQAAREMDALIESFRRDCVIEPGEQVPPNPGPAPLGGNSLYAQLGGVYPIALFTDRLVDALLVDERIHIPVDEDRRTEAALKYLFTEVFCYTAGGQELITCAEWDETKLLVPKAAWGIVLATAEVAADHMPKQLLQDILAALEKAKHLIVDPASKDEDVVLCGAAAQVKDVRAAASGQKLSRAALAARQAAPGLHVAARRRVFGDPRTMYGRVGGVFGLARLSSRLMDVWMENPILNANRLVARWHETHQVYGFKFLVTQILAYLTGGPQRYTGRPMDVAHKHLNINIAQWDAFMRDADKVFLEFQVETRVQETLRHIIADFRPSCTVNPGERPWVDPGPSRPGETTVGTLYHSLGGVYPIARFVDRLVELVLRGNRVQVESHPISDRAGTRHPPGLKYMVTELVCRGTGGPEVVTSRGFDDAKLGVQPQQWSEFMALAGEAAAEVFNNPQLRTALLSALRVLKSEICVGVEESMTESAPDDGSRRLREGTLNDVAVAAARGGDESKAAPQARAENFPRCPFMAMPDSLRKCLPSATAEMDQSITSEADVDSDPARGTVSQVDLLASSLSVQLPGQPDLDEGEVTLDASRLEDDLANNGTPNGGHKQMVVRRELGNPLQDKLDDLLAEDPELCCPVSLMLMLDPVIASDGFVYEKASFQTVLRTGMQSPMSYMVLNNECRPAVQHKVQVTEFRRARSRELLDFAKRNCKVVPDLVLPGLERVGEYVQVLRPEKEQELVKEAAEVWVEMGQPVPPELTGGLTKRVARRSSLTRSPTRSMKPSGAAKAAVTALPKSSRAGFQQRLNLLLSTEDGPSALAKKLYTRFEGRVEALSDIQSFLEDKWGFSGALFPILWSHLRRVVFQCRNEHLELPSSVDQSRSRVRVKDVLQPTTNTSASSRVEESEWVAAFVRWLQAIQARNAVTKVARSNLVAEREAAKASEMRDVYFQGPQLGEGAFGEVFLMLHKVLGVERVVKSIKKEQLSTGEDNIAGEVGVLKSLDHPHIVRIYETYSTEDAHHIVMDYAAGGDLASVMKKAKEEERSLSEDWIRVAMDQMLAALEYVHMNGVIHCDLKPANVMLLAPVDLEKGDMPHVLLVDFGLAEIFEERNMGGTANCKGTPLYLAPEAFEGHLSQKSDIWAAGVLLYEMILGKRPFQGNSMFAIWSKAAKMDPDMEGIPPLASAVVKAMLIKQAQDRPTAKECRIMEWFGAASAPQESGASPSSPLAPKSVIGAANYFHRAAMFCIATEMSMKDMDHVFQVFKAIDTTKSGRLTLEQLAEGLRRLGIDQDPSEVMSILDLDQNGYVSYTEFLAGVLGTDEGLSERLVQEAFDMFDLDGDGCISLKELKLMLAGDGPLVDVLPDGHTVEEVMVEVSNGEDVITFSNFKRYLRKVAKASKGLDKDGKPLEGADRSGSRLANRASLDEMLVEADVPAPVPEAVSFCMGTGEPAAPTDLNPPLHRWVADMLNESQDERQALAHLLEFPAPTCSPTQSPTPSVDLSRHFLAAACLSRTLAERGVKALVPGDEQHLRCDVLSLLSTFEDALSASSAN